MDNASKDILAAVPEEQYGRYRISSEILNITLSMPGIKNLAIVDLPGLIGDDDDTGAKEQIESITRMFIRRHDSLVVTVIPAASDAGGVDTAARTLRDPAEKNFYDRSVCVITKPDVANLHVATEQAKAWKNALTFRYMHSTLHSKIVEHLSDNNRSVNQIKDGKVGPTLLRPATARQEQFFVDDLIQYAFRNRSFICPEEFGPRGASVRPHALHRDAAPTPPKEWLKWPVDQWTTEKQEIDFFVQKLKDQMGPEGQAQVNHRFVEDLYRYMSVRFHDIAEHHRLVIMSTIRRYFEETILYFLENPYGDTIHKPFINAEKLAHRFYSSYIDGDVVKRGSEAKAELKRLELDRKDIMLSIDAEAYKDRIGFRNLKRFKELHRASIVLAATALTSHDPEPADQEKHARAAGMFEERDILASNAEENAYVAYKTYQRGRYVWGQNVIY
ncbi:hypothetical protein CABS01_11726 [Colletotrichum abscissum]|uniref:Dynamin family protein n=1 Tax=Colletotrichum abscissum TaxID=1671311 RepID=A0A9Q0AZH2_9PEZI|nr:uncharacterized protein CABS01_11726 [Colletotrichum abscissum]KAI3548692.1 hypothetical protein CABS02_08222 [Colletotrichum abscissum]KAK1492829.1 hypothetical protein CABS01_11726 [Colletotrichum abscissum]